MTKRTFDTLTAACGLILLSPLLLVLAAAVKLTSTGPILYRQERLGRWGRPFRIYKFRSMVRDADRRGGLLTVGGDARVTRIGRFLRRHKLDELPQLINVLKGEMSMVGPRPEVPEYAHLFPESYRHILQVRPGITHRTTLMFRDEERLLAKADDPRRLYLERIMPYKVMLYVQGLRRESVAADVSTIVATVLNAARTITAEELERAVADMPHLVPRRRFAAPVPASAAAVPAARRLRLVGAGDDDRLVAANAGGVA